MTTSRPSACCATTSARGRGDLTPRFLKLDTGYRETQWIGNCVAVGLSAGFLEPLESSGIGLIEAAAYLIAYLFPADGNRSSRPRASSTS
jgi:hypothetical protein